MLIRDGSETFTPIKMKQILKQYSSHWRKLFAFTERYLPLQKVICPYRKLFALTESYLPLQKAICLYRQLFAFTEISVLNKGCGNTLGRISDSCFWYIWLNIRNTNNYEISEVKCHLIFTFYLLKITFPNLPSRHETRSCFDFRELTTERHITCLDFAVRYLQLTSEYHHFKGRKST